MDKKWERIIDKLHFWSNESVVFEFALIVIQIL